MGSGCLLCILWLLCRACVRCWLRPPRLQDEVVSCCACGHLNSKSGPYGYLLCLLSLAKMCLLGVLLSSLMDGDAHAFLLEWGIPLDNLAAPGWCSYFFEFWHCPRRIRMALIAHNQAFITTRHFLAE